jgi:carbamoylphosphate synthase small subunit
MRLDDENTKKRVLELTSPPAVLPRLDPHFTRNRDVMLRFLEGQSIPQIAADKGLDEKQVKAILRRQPLKAEIHRLAGLANDRYIQERVDMLTIEALDTVRDTMRGENSNELRFKAASKVLDHSPILKAKEQTALGAIGSGIGEAIIRHLAKEDADAARVRQATNITEVENETKD